MQKKTLISLLTVLTFIFNYNTFVRAASPSPSPIPSPTASPITDEEVTENLKKRLQNDLDQPKTTPTLGYTSFVGVIRDVIKNTLVIEDKDGKKKIVIKENATVVRTPGNKTIPVDSIRIDDNLISIGMLRETDELEAVRVIVSADPLNTTTKISSHARITKISKSTLTTSSINSEETTVITLNSKTTLKSSIGDTLELSDLSVGDSIIYTATQSKDTITATSLMRIGFADPQEAAPSSPSTTN